MRVWISQNNYGHWKAVVAGENSPRGGQPSPAFLTRDGAINYARATWPDLDIVADGQTNAKREPPPLPHIDPVAEARAAGIPVAP